MPRYALVIGIAQYDNFKNLPKAATDAEAIANILENYGYTVTRLPRKRVGENQWVIDPDRKLASTTLGQELKEFLRERAVWQEVVIYFAGHGFRAIDPITDEQVGYWATSDSKSCGQNAIRFDALNTLLGRAELSSLVILMDCCYAGSLLEQRSLLQPTQDVVGQKQNYYLIAACRDFEKAREGEKHGVFTAAVLKGLSEENIQQGEITSNDLFGFVSRELRKSGQEVVQAGKGRAIALVSHMSQVSNDAKAMEKGSETLLPNHASVAQTTFVPNNLTARQQRLQQKRDVLQSELDLRNEKVRRMRVASAIESNTIIKFQLEQQLLDEETRISGLINELDEIDSII